MPYSPSVPSWQVTALLLTRDKQVLTCRRAADTQMLLKMSSCCRKTTVVDRNNQCQTHTRSVLQSNSPTYSSYYSAFIGTLLCFRISDAFQKKFAHHKEIQFHFISALKRFRKVAKTDDQPCHSICQSAWNNSVFMKFNIGEFMKIRRENSS